MMPKLNPVISRHSIVTDVIVYIFSSIIYHTRLSFILIALAAALLLPSVLRADRVRFDNYGISVEIPEGGEWDSTMAEGRSEDGMLVLQAYEDEDNGDIDAAFQLNLYNNPEPTAAYRYEFPSHLVRMMVKKMEMSILGRPDTVVVGGIKGAVVHAEGPDPGDREA